ncbi:unnamed protein product [Rotaria sp. Silwood1]|nr:unnamed protein product [Rotaria sp. Silwood1]CAF1643727.1 unnamed protein product [Rotaria sp. Silwood1]CAF3814112.1 unnamed protein product [Rotaria sp. Silwood1]CAF4948764.1 unnamed protein product [Rotaria sp. Silwood1]
MQAAGLRYTGVSDTVRCDTCHVEISGWTATMNPFIIHAEKSPNCSFIQSKKSFYAGMPTIDSQPSTVNFIGTKLEMSDETNPSKRQKIETIPKDTTQNLLIEVNALKQARRRSFSHWLQEKAPSRDQMIEAGFFCCNVGDRVICIYCNLICQQWISSSDDPIEVHKTLRPRCSFVVSMMRRCEKLPVSIVNETINNHASIMNGVAVSNAFRYNEIIPIAACHPAYIEIPKRQASFANWPTDSLPSIDDLVRAGFFYTGTKSIVTCFYCNGSLKNWGPNDNPTIEHARWYPHCAYAKQLCGDELYRKIQECNRERNKQVERIESTERNGVSGTSNNNSCGNSFKLHIADESTLSRLVAARLDLSISQRLLDQNFKLSIIKRCWEDQLRLKRI